MLDPCQDPTTQAARLHHCIHEIYLFDRGLKEKLREISKSALAERPMLFTADWCLSGLVARLKEGSVFLFAER
jgi:hypothetical protein